MITWAQTGSGSDMNANDYSAGTYTYIQTGPQTALLTNVDIGMMSALGTTNVTTRELDVHQRHQRPTTPGRTKIVPARGR